MLRIVIVTCCISLFMGFVGKSPSPQNSSPGDFLNLKINQDLTTELQNEEQIAVNPLNGQNLVAVWRDWRLGFRQVGFGASFDGGLTWTEGLLVEPRFTQQSDPGLTYDADGNFYVVVVSFEAFGDSNSLAVFKTTDGGLTWGSPSYAVVSGPESFEDKELIACDRTDNPTRGNLYNSWTRFDSGLNRDILFIRSTDGGVSWSSPAQVSDVQDVQWSVPAVGANGEIYVAWVDFSSSNILLDKSTDGGMTFGVDIPIAPVNFSGNINGGILVFPFPALDVDISGGPLNGNLYVTYMWDSGTDMDLFFRRSTDQGTTWSSAARVNDDLFGNGADQFHPWLTVDQNGTITIVFFDRRLDPGNLLFDLYMTQSFNGGFTFTPNERISTVSSVPLSMEIEPPSSLAPGRAGLLGEYIGVASFYGELHPIWTDTRNGHQDVYTAVDTSQFRDVEVFSILSPNDTVSCGLITPLSATVCNTGNRIESFDVIGLIDSSGSPLFWDTVKVMGLEPDSCVIVNFNDWLVPNVDSTCYTFTVFTQLPIDESPGNDTLSKGFCALCNVGIEERSKFETGSKKFQLFQNSPNPFSAAGERPTIIGYALPQSTQMTLMIYDVTGKPVKTLVEGKQDKGFNRVRWDGRNENGKKVPTGVYFYKLKAGGLTETRKIILMR